MRFENVCIESIAVALPVETWTSTDLEERLRPLYERLRLPFGRLELMTGIRERRMWPDGTLPSEASAAAGRADVWRGDAPAANGPRGFPGRPGPAAGCARAHTRILPTDLPS